MKYFVICFLALTLIWIKHVQTLQIDYMDSGITSVNLKDPSWGISSSGILRSHSGVAYSSNKNRTLTVYAPSGYSILAAIRQIDLRPNNQDSLKLFAVNDHVANSTYTNSERFQRKRYYPQEELTFYAPGGRLGVTFATGPSYFTVGYDGFELVYTVQANWIQCKSRDFHCNNGRCIASALKCDGHNHCGDGSSESNCHTHNSGRTVGISFGVIFLLIAIGCGVFIFIRRSRRSDISTQAIVSTHPPPTSNLPSYPPAYPQPGTYYPPPPPPYSQGVTNPTYH